MSLKIRIIRNGHITKCPNMSLDFNHYDSKGNCKCIKKKLKKQVSKKGK